MKRSTLIRRLMTMSIIFEEIYFLLITVIYIFRPSFYTNALVSVYGLEADKIPANDPSTPLMITIYGGVVVYFILWFIMKILMDTDSDPLMLGIITFLILPVGQVVYTYMYGKTLLTYQKLGAGEFAFQSMNFTVMKYCGWANIAAFIFLLMAYAVARQKHADLD